MTATQTTRNKASQTPQNPALSSSPPPKTAQATQEAQTTQQATVSNKSTPEKMPLPHEANHQAQKLINTPAKQTKHTHTSSAVKTQQTQQQTQQTADRLMLLLQGGRVAAIDITSLIHELKKANVQKAFDILNKTGKQTLQSFRNIPAAQLEKHLKHLESLGKDLNISGIALGVLVGFKDTLEALQKGDYADAAGILYKTVLGAFLANKNCSWPGMINNARSLITGLFPQLADHPMWAVLGQLDPLELGAKAIDTVVTLMTKGFDLKEMEKLIERYKKSGFGWLVRLGEYLGDVLAGKTAEETNPPQKQTPPKQAKVKQEPTKPEPIKQEQNKNDRALIESSIKERSFVGRLR